jgi:hypothetical protein
LILFEKNQIKLKMSLNINIKTLTSESFTLHINDDINVFELKQRIEWGMKNPYRFQDIILIHNNRKLQNDEIVSFLNNDSIIYVKIDMRPDHLRNDL